MGTLISQIWRTIIWKQGLIFLVWNQELELQSSWKWQRDRCHLSQRKNFLPVRSLQVWNRLPWWEVSSPLLDVFRDRMFKRQGACRGGSFSKLGKSGADLYVFIFYAKSTSVSVGCIQRFLHYKSDNILLHFCVSTHPLEFTKCFQLHDLINSSGQIFEKNYYTHFRVEESKEMKGQEKQINDKIKGNYQTSFGGSFFLLWNHRPRTFISFSGWRDEKYQMLDKGAMFSKGLRSCYWFQEWAEHFPCSSKSRKYWIFEANKHIINGSAFSRPQHAPGWDQADRCPSVKE